MCISLIIQGKDYIDCIESANNMWCSSKPGIWGNGILENAEKLGRLGEKALSLYLNLPVDFSYRKYGDTGDLIFHKSIDIKTASRNYKKMLIQGENEFGQLIPLKSDYYVAAYCNYIDIEGKKAKITIVGWIRRESIINNKLVSAIRGLHKNYQIGYNELIPIKLLKSEINGK